MSGTVQASNEPVLGDDGKASAGAFRLFPRAFKYLKPYKLSAFVTIVLTIIIAVLSLAEPWPLAFVIDTALGKHKPPTWVTAIVGNGAGRLVIFAVTASLLVTALTGAAKIANEFVTNKIDRRMALDLRGEILQHVQQLSLAFHDEADTGDLMFRINDQADSVGKIVLAVPDFAQSLLTLIGMLFIAFRIDPLLALISMTVIPLVLWSTAHYANKIEPELHRVRDMESDNLSLVHEGLSMHKVIVAFGRERYEYRRFRRQGEGTVDARVRLTVRQALFKLAVNSFTAAGTAAVVGVGAQRVVSGHISAGQLLVMVSYIAAVYRPLETLTYSITLLQDQLVAFTLALELLDTTLDVTEKPDAVKIERARGDITFENVGFSYRTRPNTLEGISFSIKAGQAVAIVGATGAGKSTLVSLMPRLYDAHVGRVTIDGTDVRDLTLRSVRSQFSVVLQEPLLFSNSIRENIAYGRSSASDDEIERAARDANAHDFISRLPKGYDTRLGERGTKVSGGERQRIAVARAFLRDAPILILDEPTSSIDSRTEAVILDALDRLMEGRTTIIIAHRLSTIRRADTILVLHQGRLVEAGSHEELCAREGAYRDLWNAQNLRRLRTETARTVAASIGAAEPSSEHSPQPSIA